MNKHKFVGAVVTLSLMATTAPSRAQVNTLQVPGVVGLAGSVEQDSFRGGLLDYPHYTRPPVVEGLTVPEVLTSGDHAKIRRWREREALKATLEKRPDLLERPEVQAGLTVEQRRGLAEWRGKD